MTEAVERLMREVDEYLETRELVEDVLLTEKEAETFRHAGYKLEINTVNPTRSTVWTSYNVCK